MPISPGPTRATDDPRLARLSLELEGMRRDQATIDAACARLAEAMAAAAQRLAEVARDADFRPPPWPGGIDRTVEIRLSETREVTLRMGAGAAGEPSQGRAG